MATPPAPVTIGESLAHISRLDKWTMAVISQIGCPGGITLCLLYGFGPSFFTSVPWRLALLLSWAAYLSVLFMVMFHAVLSLTRTPVAVVETLTGVGMWGVGGAVIGVMESVVFAVRVDDRRILAGCTGVVAAFIVALVAFWVWLARTYGPVEEEDGQLVRISSRAPSCGGVARANIV